MEQGENRPNMSLSTKNNSPFSTFLFFEDKIIRKPIWSLKYTMAKAYKRKKSVRNIFEKKGNGVKKNTQLHNKKHLELVCLAKLKELKIIITTSFSHGNTYNH